jgi:MFS family permease
VPTDQADPPFRLRSLTVSVYLPTLLFAIGQGAVIPVIPLLARDLGASVAVASLVVALRGFGTMGFDIPAGLLVSRVGERWAMVFATIALAAVAVMAALSPNIAVYAVLVFAMGCAWSVWLLARLSFVTDIAPVVQRGRALSLLGGVNRVGNFVGPFAGGFAAEFMGRDSALYVQAGLATAACAVLFFFVRGEPSSPADVPHAGGAYQRLGRVVAENRRVFLTAGLAATAIGVLRSSRQAVIPLWGDNLGLSDAEIGIIFGVSSAIDMTLFYPVGVVMDRWGRKWAGVPCLLTMSVGLALIPLTGDFVSLLGASLLTSFGNGLGSGIVMTLGADFSPPIGRADFLGVWRLVADVGTAGGPALLGAVAAIAGLSAATVATGGLGLAGAAVMAFLVTEPLRRDQPRAAPGPAG